MTITSRISLAAQLEDGDTLQGSVLSDLIDSYLHLTDTTAQSVASPVSFTGSCSFTNLNLADIDTSSINFAHAQGGSIQASGVRVTTILSGNSAHFDGEVSANNSIYASAARVKLVSTNVVNTGQINVSAVSAGVVNAGQVNTSAISAGSMVIGIITASAISANKIWASALDVYSAISIFASSTSVATGTGSATPASVAGFIKVNFNGSEVFLPYYTGS